MIMSFGKKALQKNSERSFVSDRSCDTQNFTKRFSPLCINCQTNPYNN